MLHTIASAKKFDIITFLNFLENPLTVSLQHLCPSAVAIVLQWEAAVAVQAGPDERLFLFFFSSTQLQPT